MLETMTPDIRNVFARVFCARFYERHTGLKKRKKKREKKRLCPFNQIVPTRLIKRDNISQPVPGD